MLVGHDKDEFTIHEDNITSSSEFFKKAMSGDWKEKEARQVELPDTTSRAFEIYVKWLYTGLFYITEHGDINAKSECKDGVVRDSELNNWAECYALAGFVCDDDFRDALIDGAIDRMHTDDAYYLTLAKEIYLHTAPKSLHREFAIDCTVKLCDSEDFGLFVKAKFPEDFKDDLIMAIVVDMPYAIQCQSVEEFLEDIEPCQYHEHRAKHTPCYKTKRNLPL